MKTTKEASITQTISRGGPIGELWDSIQSCLFPALEDEIGGLGLCHHKP